MAYYVIPLKAGVPYTQTAIGTVILVDAIDGAVGVDIQPVLNGNPQKNMPQRRVAFKYSTKFDAVILKATVDCTVSIFLTDNDVNLGFTNGSQVNVLGSVAITNGGDQRVPVDLAGGTVNVTASNVGINNDAAHPVPVSLPAMNTLVDHVPALINTGAAQLMVIDATFRRLRIRNASAVATVAIGGPAVTLANAAIVLQPGDTWAEDDAAGAAWYATSDTNGADVRVMGVK